jgi:hypothetical protein
MTPRFRDIGGTRRRLIDSDDPDDDRGDDEVDNAEEDDPEDIAEPTIGSIGDLDPAVLGVEQFCQGLSAGTIHAILLDEEAAEPEPPKPPPRENGAAGNGHYQGNGANAHEDDDEDQNDAGYPHGEQRGRRVAVYVYQDHIGRNHTRVEKRAARTRNIRNRSG